MCQSRSFWEPARNFPIAASFIRLCPARRAAPPVWIDDGNLVRVSGNAEHAPRRVVDFLKREARKILDERVSHYAAQLGTKPSRITVRDTASRWGSCSATRSLSFSWRLIFAPEFVLDYVVAHEVAHMKEMNHGPRFWKLVDLLGAEVARAQRWLSEHGTSLHRYGPRISGN